MNELKYVRFSQYNSVVVFPTTLEHRDFKNFGEIVGAGFCRIYGREVSCYGESVGLGIKSQPSDSYWCTKQFFGWEAADVLVQK